MERITLKEVTNENIEKILNLQVKPEQSHFVATTCKSLAYAYVNRKETNPYGIYAEDQLVGYVSIIFDTEDQMYNIWHLLIDQRFQGHGYGKGAMAAIMAVVKEKAIGRTDKVALGVEPENTPAIKLYEGFGFVDTGEKVDGEIVMVCEI